MFVYTVEAMYPEVPGKWLLLHNDIGPDLPKALSYLRILERENTDGWALGYRINVRCLI